jgi:hypothetical protein
VAANILLILDSGSVGGPGPLPGVALDLSVEEFSTTPFGGEVVSDGLVHFWQSHGRETTQGPAKGNADVEPRMSHTVQGRR